MKFYKVTDQSIIENIKIAFQQRADLKTNGMILLNHLDLKVQV